MSRRRHSLGYPLYVNGRLFNEPVTISHVPGMGAVDPSMGALGQYVAYAPRLPPLGVLPGSTRASLAPVPTPPAPAPASEGIVSPFLRVWKYLAPVSSLACAYHGYRRNDSILWALWWGLVGSMPITPVIALAQGFGKKKGMTPNRRKRNGLTRRQLGARRGAKKRAMGGTELWSVIDRSTNRTIGTLIEPAWKSYDQVGEEARAKYGDDAYVTHKRKQNPKRRRR